LILYSTGTVVQSPLFDSVDIEGEGMNWKTNYRHERRKCARQKKNPVFLSDQGFCGLSFGSQTILTMKKV
jgi:hypothetical protein